MLHGAAVGFAALLLLLPFANLAWGARCDDVASRGYLKILTINLLAPEVDDRDRRLAIIANYIAKKTVDVIIMQEVVSGSLVDTDNSVRDLQEKLADKGLDYERRTEFEAGVPGLLEIGNGILSRCHILFELSKRLPAASEIEILGLDIKLPRIVHMTRLKIPGFGRFSVYNTHLCAGCTFSEHKEQVEVLLAFVNKTERSLPPDDPIMLGGDFNIDRFKESPREVRVYRLIVNQGFADAYVEAQTVGLGKLCEPDDTDEHCTIGEGVTELSETSPKRIDYIFTRDFGAARTSTNVVFNSLADPRSGAAGKTVSDHAGVHLRANLP
jgi:maltose 6'-phosphate phosphatase